MAETIAAIDDSRAARLAGDRRWHRELVKRSKDQLQADREGVASELATDVEEDFNIDKLRPDFRAIKRLSYEHLSNLNEKHPLIETYLLCL